MKTSWIQIAAPPVGIYINDDIGGPRHPLTPDTVRKKRGNDIRLDGVAWREDPLCGIIIGITERTWQSRDIDHFTLSSLSNGYTSFAVTATSVTKPHDIIISSDDCIDSQLIWFRELLTAINTLGFATDDKSKDKSRKHTGMQILGKASALLGDAFEIIWEGGKAVILLAIIVVILGSCGKIFMNEGLEGFVDRIWHGPVK